MARQRNGSANTAPVSAEQATEAPAPEQAPPEPQGDGSPENPPTAQEGERGQRSETVAELAADGGLLGEPGPEDFARHTGARLIQDHEHDLRLQAEVDDRIRRRGHEIATRLRKSGPNATVTIGGKEHVARQRPANSGGGMLLAEVGKRVAASLD